MALAALAVAVSLAAPPISAQQTGALRLGVEEMRAAGAVRTLAASGTPEKVTAAARAYLKAHPRGRYADEVLLTLGQALSAAGNPADALKTYGRLIRDFPESPFREEALVKSLPLLQQAGAEQTANEHLAVLLKNYPRSLYLARALLWRSQELLRRKEPAQALQVLGRIDPQTSLSKADRTEQIRLTAWAQHHLGPPEKALPVFARYVAREDTPAHLAPALMLLAEAAREGKRWPEALAYYTRVATGKPVPPHHAEALYWRGALFLRAQPGADEPPSQTRGQAISHLGAYLETGAKRHRTAALRHRAELYAAAENRAAALADYEALLALEPGLTNDPHLVEVRAGLLGGLGRSEEAIQLLRRAIAEVGLPRPARTNLQLQLAGMHYAREDCPAALGLLDPLPPVSGSQARQRAVFMRGFCLFRKGEWERASWDMESLTREEAYFLPVWPSLLEAYERSGQHARLVNIVEEMLAAGRIKPSAPLMERVGAAYGKLGQPARMLASYRRMGEADPATLHSVRVRFRMGTAAEALGEAQQAMTHYEAAIAQQETDGLPLLAEYWQALGRMLTLRLGRNEHPQALALAAAAEKFATTPADKARANALKRKALFDWGRTRPGTTPDAEALERLERAWALAGDASPAERRAILRELGRAYAHRNTHPKAVALYRKELQRTLPAPDAAALREEFSAFYGRWAAAQEAGGQTQGAETSYGHALALRPQAQWRERVALAAKLDALYEKRQAHAERATLYAKLGPTVPDAALRDKLHRYRSRILLSWGDGLGKANQDRAALARLEEGRALLGPDEWRARYDFTVATGRIYLKRKEYTELVLVYQDALAEVPEEALRGQIAHFIGQVYLEWGHAAARQQNDKSTRIRYEKALDYLPAQDWKGRVAAVRGLAAVYERQKELPRALALYAQVIPTIGDDAARRQYGLFLARQYQGKLQDTAQARRWFKTGDGGGNDAISLEAGYELALLDAEAKHRTKALAALKQLVQRNISASNWRVPIHYKLAVLYHEEKHLKQALLHYEQVAAVQSAALLKLYPRAIAHAKRQAQAIRDYLSLQGAGGISLPKVN